ncbi:metallophosphoesterase family protein [Tepidibacter hydrothermalis]|uniref:Phosphoesterase n=1 Tax=Tepidibacter hydrothermalis TaxID=3036126 RepID=A0ABY8EIQ3_9FIRM|nr:metallophosphoesterase family protein [Tepidibacter hydrothermalis]WFD11599.1 metallophosphoesterase family protein [Tepidibacter hydrothermalis]
MKIGIISDTHGLLRDEVVQHLQGCEYIFHAGDIGSEELLYDLQEIGHVYAVRGNVDREKWGYTLPFKVSGVIDNLRFCMVHDKKDIPKNLENIDLIIYGHSHKYEDKEIQGVRYFNPGSCGKKRFSLPLSMGIGEINGERILFEKINIM